MKKISWRIIFLFLSLIVALVACDNDDDDDDTDTIAETQQNKEKGESFLLSMSSQEGVYSDPSGLLYSIITDTDGEQPGAKDTVAISYTGTLIDGTKFITLEDTVSMEDVLEGLHIGLRHMTVGSEYKLYIPYFLMYGASPITTTYNGNTVTLLGFSALIYDMKLNAIYKKD